MSPGVLGRILNFRAPGRELGTCLQKAASKKAREERGVDDRFRPVLFFHAATDATAAAAAVKSRPTEGQLERVPSIGIERGCRWLCVWPLLRRSNLKLRRRRRLDQTSYNARPATAWTGVSVWGLPKPRRPFASSKDLSEMLLCRGVTDAQLREAAKLICVCALLDLQYPVIVCLWRAPSRDLPLHHNRREASPLRRLVLCAKGRPTSLCKLEY